MSGVKRFICSLAVPLFDYGVGGYFKVRSMVRKELQRTEKPLVVIIPSYNNARYYRRNLDSILSQRYQNFRVIYIDDQSSDGTGDLVDAYLKQKFQNFQVKGSNQQGLDFQDFKLQSFRSQSCYSQSSQRSNQQTIHTQDTHFQDALLDNSRVQLIKNTERKGALANLYDAIHSCRDEEIIVTIDGDDWFAHRDVLARINREYQEHDAWLTYGNYISFPWARSSICKSIEVAVHATRSYRLAPWVTSHTRTFYAWLFKKIRKEDLQEEGVFLAVTWDMAFMFPMLEMAGAEHVRYIPEITYIYNVETPLNDYKLRVLEQHRLEKRVRSQSSYAQIPDKKESI